MPGNQIRVLGDRFRLTPSGSGKLIEGLASPSGTIAVVDGSAFASPPAFAAGSANDLPMVTDQFRYRGEPRNRVPAFESREDANAPVSQGLYRGAPNL